ncbi:hypothetical protein BaRGS_00035115 [Batillaria attramentaria]|uniref:Uncharacterized protein n=1 Tax=Batillaria attramentaria TaxID=370345 RepID=A0ABD0JFJ8_9CAEN
MVVLGSSLCLPCKRPGKYTAAWEHSKSFVNSKDNIQSRIISKVRSSKGTVPDSLVVEGIFLGDLLGDNDMSAVRNCYRQTRSTVFTLSPADAVSWDVFLFFMSSAVHQTWSSSVDLSGHIWFRS